MEQKDWNAIRNIHYRLQRQQQRQQRKEDAAQAVYRFMLIAILIVALLFIVTRTSYAGGAGDDMDLNTFFGVQQLTYGQKLTYLAALAATDYKQTVDTVVAQPDRYQELDPVLGPHPDRRALALFGAGGLALAAAFAAYFPESGLKHVIIDSVIATEQVNVRENRDVGLSRGRRTGMPVMVVFSFNY